MSEGNGFAVLCGPPDASGRRVVSATFGKLQHRDRFDPDDAFKRAKFRDAVISKFQWDDEAHEPLETRILAAAGSEQPGAQVECSIVRLSDVAPERVEWLWNERIAIGKLTLIVGDPGQGKSFLTLDIAARISRGAVWPDNQWEPQPAGDVILISCEDDLGDTIRPRLDALAADVSRIIAIKGAKYADEAHDRMLNLSTDLDSIRRVVQSANNPRLIVIDPVSAYLGKTDSHNNAEVRGVLAPLAELATDLRVAVIAVSHLRKGEGAAMYRTMGSLAFVAAARSAWVVAKDEADPSRRLMLPIKANLSPDIGGLAFAIRPHGIGGTPTVCWEVGQVDKHADEAIGQRKHGPEPSERDEVEEWLREQLANGPRPAKDLIADGDDIGFKRRTIYRAFKEIKGVSKVTGFPACAQWSLSAVPPVVPVDMPHPHSGTPGTTEPNPQNNNNSIKFLRDSSTVVPPCERQADIDDLEEF